MSNRETVQKKRNDLQLFFFQHNIYTDMMDAVIRAVFQLLYKVVFWASCVIQGIVSVL